MHSSVTSSTPAPSFVMFNRRLHFLHDRHSTACANSLSTSFHHDAAITHRLDASACFHFHLVTHHAFHQPDIFLRRALTVETSTRLHKICLCGLCNLASCNYFLARQLGCLQDDFQYDWMRSSFSHGDKVQVHFLILFPLQRRPVDDHVKFFSPYLNSFLRFADGLSGSFDLFMSWGFLPDFLFGRLSSFVKADHTSDNHRAILEVTNRTVYPLQSYTDGLLQNVLSKIRTR